MSTYFLVCDNRLAPAADHEPFPAFVTEDAAKEFIEILIEENPKFYSPDSLEVRPLDVFESADEAMKARRAAEGFFKFEGELSVDTEGAPLYIDDTNVGGFLYDHYMPENEGSRGYRSMDGKWRVTVERIDPQK